MRRRILWLCLAPLLLVAILWIGILKREHLDTCEHCCAMRSRYESTWYGLPVASQDFGWSKNLRSEIAAVIDRPCTHEKKVIIVRKRFWMGLICACPCVNGITGLANPDWLTPERRAAIEKLNRDDPGFADEFVRGCLLNKDADYFRSIVARIESESKLIDK